MRRASFTLLLLGACAGEDSAPVAELPFPLANPSSALFVASPDNTPRRGFGLLLLTKGELSCADLHVPDFEDELLASLEGEDGLLFTLEYRRRGEVDEAAPWPGLWMSGVSVGEDSRTLSPYALVDGFISRLSGGYFGGGDAWLDLDYAPGAVAQARYHTPLWSGAAQARDCGTWGPRGGGDDTGSADTDPGDAALWDTNADTGGAAFTSPTRLDTATYSCGAALDGSFLSPCDFEAPLTWAVELDAPGSSTAGCFAWGEDVRSQDDGNFNPCQAI